MGTDFNNVFLMILIFVFIINFLKTMEEILKSIKRL